MSQDKTDLSTYVAHSLRTPLSISREAVNIVLDEITGPLSPEQRETLSLAKENMDRLTCIIEGVISLHSIKFDDVILNRRQIDAGALLKAAVSRFSDEVRRRGLDFRTDFDISCEISGDRHKLDKTLDLLLEMSLKYTRSGHIGVSALERERDVEFRVFDTGENLSSADISRLLHSQGQCVDPTMRGADFGLLVAGRLVELHGGDLRVESGKDISSVVFTIPKRC